MQDNKLDKTDIIFSCSSGVLASSLDLMLNTEFGIKTAFDIGDKQVEELVKKLAKKEELKSSIGSLERKYKNKSDNFKLFEDSDKFGGSIHHHLQEFSHHPTLVGLLCSICTEFTGTAYGTRNDGSFSKEIIPNFVKDKFPEIVFKGAFKWAMHLASDVAGSRGSTSEGAGIPGPLLATIKELSSLPIFNQDDKTNKLSELCEDLFDGSITEAKFDFRTELGLVNIAINQAISVLLCEGIVCAFYSVRRLFDEMKKCNAHSLNDIKKIDFKNILPKNNPKLTRLRTISAISFSAVDMSSAAVLAYSECDGDKSKFAIGFAKRVNYFGVGRLIIAGAGETGIKFDKSFEDYRPVAERLSHEVDIVSQNIKEAVPIFDDTRELTERSVTTVTTIAAIGTPIGFITAAIGVYKEISTSVEEYKVAKEERIRIETECANAIELLETYQEEMELVVSEYMIDRLTIFGGALDQMDAALQSGDTDSFIEANNAIQSKLGKDSQFSSMDDFDVFMSSDGDFKL